VKVTPEQMEIPWLRAEVGRLQMEVEILKYVAAYFARESLAARGSRLAEPHPLA
jgi:hypothetical protein